jgi:hypothetical protein
MSPKTNTAIHPVAAVALDIDIQTALALSRATTRAFTALSPKAHRAMMDALAIEAANQEATGGPVAELVAILLKGHLNELKPVEKV